MYTTGPVQTADPDNYCGDIIDLGIGLDLTATSGALKGQRLAFEANIPLHRDLNGLQLETDWSINAAVQFSFKKNKAPQYFAAGS